jgi:serine phosphatase RsbU (regulator of sigma subunit)
LAGGFRIGAVSVPKSGEEVCGDAWSFLEHRKGLGRLTVADGLGHGPLAADAARTSIQAGEQYAAESGVGLMQRLHDALRPTRGAAVAIAEIDIEQAHVRYTGVGNIGATIVAHSGAVQHLVSHSGTAGHVAHRVAEFQYSWDPGSVLIMYSDGLISHWSMDRYPGLLRRHPSLIAGVLYRDFNRGRDDVTVVVVQQAEESQ